MRRKQNMKVKGKHVIYALVLLLVGFMLSYSYHLTTKEKNLSRISETEWEKKDKLRDEILRIQNENSTRFNELKELQAEVQEIEKNQVNNEKMTSKLVEELEQLRMVTGTVKVKGPGIVVSLRDSSYIPDQDNPNNYIVHEHHIQKVINELLISGAEAISINGQRISFNSYILCIGPVVEVDGVQYFAPFEIAAIGDVDMMESSINLKGNVKDQLVENGIEVSIEKKSEVVMEPFFSGKGRGA